MWGEAGPGLLQVRPQGPWGGRQGERGLRSLPPLPLQLPAGTHVVVDASVLSEGALNEAGLRSLHGLAALAGAQTLQHFFPFAAQGGVPFAADTPVLVLAAGGAGVAGGGGTRSLLPVDVSVPLSADAQAALLLNAGGSPAAAAAGGGGGSSSAAALSRVRAFLAAVRHLPFSLEPAAAAAIQADWLDLRKARAARRGGLQLLLPPCCCLCFTPPPAAAVGGPLRPRAGDARAAARVAQPGAARGAVLRRGGAGARPLGLAARPRGAAL